MNLEQEFERSLLEPFEESFPEALIRRSFYGKSVILCFFCKSKEEVRELWRKRREISQKVGEAGISEYIALCLINKYFYPPFRPQDFGVFPKLNDPKIE